MAYGARLESVLGASPRGFESPILRHRTPGPLQVPGFLLPAAPPDLRPPRVLPAREPSAPRASLGASSRSPARPRRPRGGLQSGGACGCEWPGPAAAHRHRGRSLRRPPHRRHLYRLDKPGQAPPPPTGTAVRPSGPSGALHTGGTCGAVCPGRQSGGPALPSPGLVPLDSEALDDLCARERGQDLARHEQFRAAKARADAAPSDRARRVDEEPP